MDFDVGDLFGTLFGGTVPTTAATVAQSVAVPEPIPRPEAVELPTPAVGTEWAEVERLPDFDSLPLPGDPCPSCGRLEEWTDLLGGRHCGICEADTLDKAIQWVDQAYRLREQAQPRKPTSQDSPGCVSGGMVDTQDLGSGKPLQAMLGGFSMV